jgi:hypothetical protein
MCVINEKELEYNFEWAGKWKQLLEISALRGQRFSPSLPFSPMFTPTPERESLVLS